MYFSVGDVPLKREGIMFKRPTPGQGSFSDYPSAPPCMFADHAPPLDGTLLVKIPVVLKLSKKQRNCLCSTKTDFSK